MLPQSFFPSVCIFTFGSQNTSAVFFFSVWVGPAHHTYVCLVRIQVRCSPQMFTAVLGYCQRRPCGRSVQDSHAGFFSFSGYLSVTWTIRCLSQFTLCISCWGVVDKTPNFELRVMSSSPSSDTCWYDLGQVIQPLWVPLPPL